MSKLSFQDNTFLVTETRGQKHHISGLFILKKPKGAGRDFVADIVQSLRDSGPVESRYRSKLKFANPNLNQEWREDAEFDLNYHLRHYALAAPGSEEQMMSLVNVLHSQGLDMDRPLWEYHVIDGIRGGRFALFSKQHHAMIDGVGAMRLLHTFFAASSSVKQVVAPWAVSKHEKRKPPRQAKFIRTLEKSIRNSWQATKEAPELAGLVRRQAAAIYKGEYHKSKLPFAAPKSLFNAELGPARSVLMIDLPLAEMKAVGEATGSSVNDIFLAVSGAALRRYLLEQDDLPNEPLVAMVPLSIKTRDETAGNELAIVHCQLDMEATEPTSRLRKITGAMADEKQLYKSLSPRLARNYTNIMSVPQMAVMMAGVADKLRPSYNLVISNVSGPAKPRYLRGAVLERFVPMSIVTEGNSLNITGISYTDNFQISVLVCPTSVPHAQRIRDYIGEEFSRLSESTSPSGKRRKK